MNRNQAKELLPILQAFAEGKTIEMSSLNGWVSQNDLRMELLKSNPRVFRIKPEPKYRPFKDAEECWHEIRKHEPFGWLTSQEGEVYSLIIFIDNEGIVIGDRNNGVIGFVTATDLFKIKFADGTPFGVKVEE